MKRDVGTADRIIRIALGAFLLFQGYVNGHVWGYIGAIPLVTGAVGWCPIYSILGISTLCKDCSGSCAPKSANGEAI